EGRRCLGDVVLAPIVWRSSLETGEPEIDRQHRHSVRLVNELAEAAVSGAGPDRVRGLAEAMAADARGHFAYEDRLLGRLGFRSAAEHAAEHRRIEGRIDELLERLEAPAHC